MPAQEAHLVEAVGARVGRQGGGHEVQVEGAVEAELAGALDHPGEAGEAAGLLGPGAQVGAGGGGQPAVDLVEAAPGPHRGQGGGQGALGGGGVVGVGGGHEVEVGAHGQGGEGVVAGGVEGVAVVPQLDGHVVAAEGVDQLAEAAARRARPGRFEGGGHRALATPGEHQPVALVGGRGAGAAGAAEVGQGQAGPALLAAQLGVADGPGQQRVAAGVAGQHHQVALVGARPRVGLPHRHPPPPEGELAAEDGGQAELAGGLGHAHHPVEPVVVGDGQRLEAESGGLLGQGLGRATPRRGS